MKNLGVLVQGLCRYAIFLWFLFTLIATFSLINFENLWTNAESVLCFFLFLLLFFFFVSTHRKFATREGKLLFFKKLS